MLFTLSMSLLLILGVPQLFFLPAPAPALTLLLLPELLLPELPPSKVSRPRATDPCSARTGLLGINAVVAMEEGVAVFLPGEGETTRAP